jgi:hypothetical protein
MKKLGAGHGLYLLAGGRRPPTIACDQPEAVGAHQKRRAAEFVCALFRVANWFVRGGERALIKVLKGHRFDIVSAILRFAGAARRSSYREQLTGRPPLVLKECYSC